MFILYFNQTFEEHCGTRFYVSIFYTFFSETYPTNSANFIEIHSVESFKKATVS